MFSIIKELSTLFLGTNCDKGTFRIIMEKIPILLSTSVVESLDISMMPVFSILQLLIQD